MAYDNKTFINAVGKNIIDVTHIFNYIFIHEFSGAIGLNSCVNSGIHF